MEPSECLRASVMLVVLLAFGAHTATSTIQLHLLDQSDEEELSKEMEYRQQYSQQPYPQQPPDYNQQQQHAPPMSDNKQTFEQAFKVVKPKWNDLWAGVLVRCTFYFMHICLEIGQYFVVASNSCRLAIVAAHLNYAIARTISKPSRHTTGFATATVTN